MAERVPRGPKTGTLNTVVDGINQQRDGVRATRSDLFASDRVAVALSGIAAVVGLVYALLWLRGWPTKVQSLSMGVIGAALIAVCTVLQPQPVLALMGCCSLVIISGYLAFFHDTKAIVYSVVVAGGAATICAARVVALPDQALVAAAGWWLVVELNVVVPLAIQTVVRTLGADVVRSDHDALTGVLTRRAFYERANTLLITPGPEGYLIVAMIDLDHFKRLNDTYGHGAGDQALTAVGWALRQTSADTALIGRAGGEEFLIIDNRPLGAAQAFPSRLCAAIDELRPCIGNGLSIGRSLCRQLGASVPQ